MSPATDPISIQFNGDRVEIASGTTVMSALLSAGIATALCAVELNGEVIPHATFNETMLRDGDVVEVVTFVGGG